MKEVILKVNKAQVYDEVAKTTSYAGLKAMTKDDMASYSRMFTTDEDRMMLERFWNETCDMVTDTLKPFLSSVSEVTISHGVELSRDYSITLEMSNSYDERLTESINNSIYSYFVQSITGKWFAFGDKEEVEPYLKGAAAFLTEALQKLYYKKKPVRTPI
ncbi:MAG: hypothetical protein HXO19_09590 [Prevotella shahii]|jgi:hypothetical protein|uniref:hypothetical protein n=1 Tax=Hoylesella shahii TaxID=228603 RepID=UPI001CAF21CE|nr:hypothetical protein [Hoylesella shahii]MBF1591323.1 hypothetical protein [Hoylesella shahii]